MQIHTQRRPPTPHRLPSGTNDFFNARIAFKNRRESLLDRHTNPQVWTHFFRERNRRSGQHAILQRSQSNHANPRARL